MVEQVRRESMLPAQLLAAVMMHVAPAASAATPNQHTTDSIASSDLSAAARASATTCEMRCPKSWINNGACDAQCNIESCNWDGSDCFHDFGECYQTENGIDYRGKVSNSKSGKQCQAWSEQTPWEHDDFAHSYPYDGTGGHNSCRNPGGMKSSPWCYTLDYPHTRWELCDVGPPAVRCGSGGLKMHGDVSFSYGTIIGVEPSSFLGHSISCVFELAVYTLRAVVPTYWLDAF